MKVGDCHSRSVDDPIWRSEEFIQERIEFLDENLPVPFQRYWGEDLEYRGY